VLDNIGIKTLADSPVSHIIPAIVNCHGSSQYILHNQCTWSPRHIRQCYPVGLRRLLCWRSNIPAACRMALQSSVQQKKHQALQSSVQQKKHQVTAPQYSAFTMTRRASRQRHRRDVEGVEGGVGNESLALHQPQFPLPAILHGNATNVRVGRAQACTPCALRWWVGCKCSASPYGQFT